MGSASAVGFAWGWPESSAFSGVRFTRDLAKNHFEKFSERELREISSILAGGDADFFWQEMFAFARRVESEGRREIAATVYEAMLRPSETGVAAPATTQPLARGRLAALNGRGSLGGRGEFLLQDFFRAATDPRFWLPMCAAGATYRGIRLWAQMHWRAEAGAFARVIGHRLAPSLLGFAAEVPVFVATERALQAKAREPFASDMLHSALILGPLKLFHSGGNWVTAQVGPKGSYLSRVSSRLLPQAAMFGGTLATQRLFNPENTDVAGLLAQQLGWNIGNRLSTGLLGFPFNPVREIPTPRRTFLNLNPDFSRPLAVAGSKGAEFGRLPQHVLANSYNPVSGVGSPTPRDARELLEARLAQNQRRLAESPPQAEELATREESRLLEEILKGGWRARFAGLDQLQAFYLRQGRILGSHRYPLLKQLTENLTAQVKTEHLYEKFLIKGEDGFSFLKLPYGVPKPFALRMGRANESLPLIGSDAFSKDRILYPIYFRIRDFGLHQDVVSDLNLAKFQGLLAAKTVLSPIKVGRYSDGGYFVYDGYHRTYAALREGYTHLLGIIPRDRVRILAPRITFEQIRILPDEEMQKIIADNSSGDLQVKQDRWGIEGEED